jgi:uncharacterized protein (TIGR03067 family)
MAAASVSGSCFDPIPGDVFWRFQSMAEPNHQGDLLAPRANSKRVIAALCAPVAFAIFLWIYVLIAIPAQPVHAPVANVAAPPPMLNAKVPHQEIVVVKKAIPMPQARAKWPAPDARDRFEPTLRQQVLTGDAKIQVSVLAKSNAVRWYHLEGGLPYVDMPNGPPLTSALLNGGDVVLQCADVSADGKVVVVGCDTGEVRIWEPAKAISRRELWNLPESHVKAVTAVAVSADGRLCASAGADGAIIVWDVASGAPVVTLAKEGPEVYALAFSRDGKTLASGGEGSTIELWEVSTGRSRIALGENYYPVRHLTFSPDDRWLASGSARITLKELTGDAVLWDITPVEPRRYHLMGEAVLAIAFSLDGHKLAVGSLSFDWTGYQTGNFTLTSKPKALSKVTVWDVATARLVRGHEAAQGPLFYLWGERNRNLDLGCVAFTADANTVVWAKDDMQTQRGLAFTAKESKAVKAERDKLQGTWAMTEGTTDGKGAPPEMAGQIKLVFASKKCEIVMPGKVLDCTYHVTGEASPGQIEITTAEAKTLHGIYEIHGDTLKLCLIDRDLPRPTAFHSAPGSRASYLVLKGGQAANAGKDK